MMMNALGEESVTLFVTKRSLSLTSNSFRYLAHYENEFVLLEIA